MIQSSERMMRNESQIEALVMGVVRGEVPLDAISKIGVEIDFENGFYKLKSGNFEVSVTPSAADVGLGMLRYSSGNKKEFRKWAFFLLAESGAVDLSMLESHPQGDMLLNALWDASFEGRIGDEAIELARRLTLRTDDLSTEC